MLGQRRKPGQAEVVVVQLRALLVGAHVPRQHQHIRAKGGLGHKVGVCLQMEVGQKLDIHQPCSLRRAVQVLPRKGAPC